MLSECAQEDLTPHYESFLSKMVSKMNNRSLKPIITETLGVLETNGGEDSRQKIKSKVPSYF